MRTLTTILILVSWTCAPALAQTGTSPARAADYPTRPVRLIVGLAPGGGVDIIARMLSARLQQVWGKPVIVENKPGANSIIGLEHVAKSEPDGHTLMMAANSAFTMTPFLYAKLPYAPGDFIPVSELASSPMVLAVHPSVPVNSLAELIAYARANPGKLNYGAGAATFHVGSEMFKQMAGVGINAVSYKGSAPTASALLAGEVQLAIIDVPAVGANVRSGRLKALAVTTARRIDTLPSTPTFAEAGLAGYEMSASISLFAPAGTPAGVVAVLGAEAVRFVQSAEAREKIAAMGMLTVGSSAAEFAAALRREAAKFGAVIKAANMTVN